MAKPRAIKKKGTVWAVIVAGGSSRRMGFNKLTADLEGRPVVAWTMAAFNDCPAVDAIVLVCAASAQSELEKIARDASPKKLHSIVAGGLPVMS